MTSKKYQQKSKKRQRKMKGGCGCSGQQTPNFFSGGERRSKFKGGDALGPATITPDSVDQYTYSIFDVNADHLNPNQITDSRQLPNMIGGKRRTRKYNKKHSKKHYKKRRSYKKYNGGADQEIQNYDKNILSNSSPITAANIVSGNTSDILSPLTRPIFL
jgi:hypothetical protein